MRREDACAGEELACLPQELWAEACLVEGPEGPCLHGLEGGGQQRAPVGLLGGSVAAAKWLRIKGGRRLRQSSAAGSSAALRCP